jgi:hypothetical protein
MDVRRQLTDGLVDLPRVGKVVKVPGGIPPFRVVDADNGEVEAVTAYLRDLVLSDCSPKTVPAYASDLLRWFRPVVGSGCGLGEGDRSRGRAAGRLDA